MSINIYRGADKSLARPGKKQDNISVRMVWIFFGALPCRGDKNCWELGSRCCWNNARPSHASEFVFFPVGLRIYQHLGIVEELTMFQFTTRNSRPEFERFMTLKAARHKLSQCLVCREAMAYSKLVGTSLLSLRTINRTTVTVTELKNKCTAFRRSWSSTNKKVKVK